MRLTYAIMPYNYVDMQHNYVDMQRYVSRMLA